MLESIKQWFADRYEQFQEWLLELVLWIPRKVWEEFLDELAGVLESLGIPSFIIQASALLGSWGSDASYWFDLLQFNWGFSLVVSAISIRWAWSKVPFLGR